MKKFLVLGVLALCLAAVPAKACNYYGSVASFRSYYYPAPIVYSFTQSATSCPCPNTQASTATCTASHTAPVVGSYSAPSPLAVVGNAYANTSYGYNTLRVVNGYNYYSRIRAVRRTLKVVTPVKFTTFRTVKSFRSPVRVDVKTVRSNPVRINVQSFRSAPIRRGGVFPTIGRFLFGRRVN